jgi:hypothetical protein
MRAPSTLAILIASLVGACGGEEAAAPPPRPVSPAPVAPELLATRARYGANRAVLIATRDVLARRFADASESEPRLSILAEGRVALLAAFDDALMPAWTQTPWDFSGTSATPGVGHIACGHFVSTIIQHLGFDVNRIRLGQLASGDILRTFVSREDVMPFSNKPADVVIARVKEHGDGLR